MPRCGATDLTKEACLLMAEAHFLFDAEAYMWQWLMIWAAWEDFSNDKL
jgi:hypothetical protein